MKRLREILVVSVLVAVCTAWVCTAHTYAAYYDCSNGRETVLTIINADAFQTDYTLALYSPIGTRIGEAAGALAPYASAEHVVGDLLVPGWEADACGRADRPKNKGQLVLCRGGLALVEAPASLLVRVAFIDEGAAPIVANVDQAVPADRDHVNYWYAVGYENTSTRRTRLTIANPYNERMGATFSLYDADGDLKNMIRLYPIEFEVGTYDISDYFADSEETTGVIDIYASFPIVVVVEYMDEDGTLLNLEQTSHFHFFLD